jgi:long-chain fatty acid transport protein
MRSLIIAVTILAPASAMAGGYLVPSAAPREVALGQAAIAAQDGPEAVYLNTAALAGQEGFAAGFGGEVLNNRTEWSDPTLGSAKQSQTNTPVGIAVSYGDRLPGGIPWGIGIGFGVPAGGSLDWPKGWAGQEFINSVDQKIYGFGGGIAIQPLPFLKVGASFIRFQATEELHQSLNFLDHFADAGIALSGGANSFGVATELRVPTVPLSIGATFSYHAKIPLEGDAHFEGVPPGFQTMLHDQNVSEELIIPSVFSVGAAYEAIPGLKLMADYELEMWSIYHTDTFKGTDVTVNVPRNYKNAHVIRAAGEYARLPFMQELTLRAGVLRSISDQPKDTLSPSLTDASSWAISLGGGYNIMPNLRVDVGYQHAFFDKVTAALGSDAFQGSYKTNVDIVSVGVSWRKDVTMSPAR